MSRTDAVDNNRAISLLRALEFIYWSGNGMFYSFYVPFMAERSLSYSQIGLILSINALLLLATLPIWGVLTDKTKSPKLVLMIIFICSSVIMMFVPMLEGKLAVALGICTIAVFESSIATMLDSYLVQAIRLVPGASYGSIRLWGSVGIVISLIFSANIVKSFGTKAVFYYYGISLVLLLPILMLLPKVHTRGKKIQKMQPKALFFNIRYISFVAFVTLLFIPYRFSASFLIEIIQHVKGTTENLSISLLVSYGSEIVLYFLSIYLFRHFPLTKIIYASSIFFVLRQLLFSLVQHPYHVYLAQITHGPSFTLMSAAALLYINELAPGNMKSTAQAVGNGFLFGISGIISNALGGYLIDTIGTVKTFYTGAFLSVAAIIIYTLLDYATDFGSEIHSRNIQKNSNSI